MAGDQHLKPERGILLRGRFASSSNGIFFFWLPRPRKPVNVTASVTRQCGAFRAPFWSGDPHALHTSNGNSSGKFCIDRARLAQEYTTAILRHTRLHADRVSAVIKGLGLPSAGEVIEAEIQRDNVKIALLAHQKAHGC